VAGIVADNGPISGDNGRVRDRLRGIPARRAPEEEKRREERREKKR
jgi:hypothetical protein